MRSPAFSPVLLLIGAAALSSRVSGGSQSEILIQTPQPRDTIRSGTVVKGKATGSLRLDVLDPRGRLLGRTELPPPSAQNGSFARPIRFQLPAGVVRGTLAVSSEGSSSRVHIPVSFAWGLERRAEALLDALRKGDVRAVSTVAQGQKVEVYVGAGREFSATVIPSTRSLAPLLQWARGTSGQRIVRRRVMANRHLDGYSVTELRLPRGYFYVGSQFDGRVTKLFASRRSIDWD